LELVQKVAEAAEKVLDESLKMGYPQVEIPTIGRYLARSSLFYRLPWLGDKLLARAFHQVDLVLAFAENEFLEKLEGKYLPQGWKRLGASSMFLGLA
jgi:hypothetical protein